MSGPRATSTSRAKCSRTTTSGTTCDRRRPGWRGQAAIAAAFRAAFPDLEFTVDLMLGDGDLVAARWTAEGTFLGPWGNLQATGKRARFSGVNIFRFVDGRVAEIWNHRDDLGLMEQVGAPVYAGSPVTGDED